MTIESELTAEEQFKQEQNNEITSENQNIKSVFISGNLDLSDKQFMQYYMPILTELAKEDFVYFNLSDDEGCSEMSQILLNKLLIDRNRVTIYCIGDTPKHYVSENFVCFHGFKTLEERNAAMTLASNNDLHVILPGKGSSSIKDNLCRRNEPLYNYMKHYIKGNTRFWQIFFQSEDLENNEETIANEETNS